MRSQKRSVRRMFGLVSVLMVLAGGLALPDSFWDWLEPAASARAGETIEVTNTNDSGPGSLRAAIERANANPGKDTIIVKLPEVSVINILQPLPPITEAVDIDACRRDCANDGVLAIGSAGNRISGFMFVIEDDDFTEQSMIRGIQLRDFGENGIDIQGSSNIVISNVVSSGNGGSVL
jgi:hypothetical protein